MACFVSNGSRRKDKYTWASSSSGSRCIVYALNQVGYSMESNDNIAQYIAYAKVRSQTLDSSDQLGVMMCCWILLLTCLNQRVDSSSQYNRKLNGSHT